MAMCIAGSPRTGLVVIMPARHVFAQAIELLESSMPTAQLFSNPPQRKDCSMTMHKSNSCEGAMPDPTSTRRVIIDPRLETLFIYEVAARQIGYQLYTNKPERTPGLAEGLLFPLKDPQSYFSKVLQIRLKGLQPHLSKTTQNMTLAVEMTFRKEIFQRHTQNLSLDLPERTTNEQDTVPADRWHNDIRPMNIMFNSAGLHSSSNVGFDPGLFSMSSREAALLPWT